MGLTICHGIFLRFLEDFLYAVRIWLEELISVSRTIVLDNFKANHYEPTINKAIEDHFAILPFPASQNH